jgi:hypothetical protein
VLPKPEYGVRAKLVISDIVMNKKNHEIYLLIMFPIMDVLTTCFN